MKKTEEIKSGGIMLGALAVVVVVVLAVLLLFGSFAKVGAGERGVVMHWGAVQPETLSPGLHAKVPFMTSVENISTQTWLSSEEAKAASSKMQEVNVTVATSWRLNDAKITDLYKRFGNRDQIQDKVVFPGVLEVVKAAAAKMTVEEVLAKRPQLKAEIDVELKKRLEASDVVVDEISITNITFGKDFTDSIEAKQVAEQSALKASYLADQAEQEARAEVNRATGLAESQRLQRETLTDGLIKMRALEVQAKAIEKWNGKLPQVNGGATPFLNLTLTQDSK